MPFAVPWMDPEIVILSQVRERQISYGITYMWNLKKIVQMNLFTKQRVTDVENLWLPRGQGGRDKLRDWA